MGFVSSPSSEVLPCRSALGALDNNHTSVLSSEPDSQHLGDEGPRSLGCGFVVRETTALIRAAKSRSRPDGRVMAVGGKDGDSVSPVLPWTPTKHLGSPKEARALHQP